MKCKKCGHDTAFICNFCSNPSRYTIECTTCCEKYMVTPDALANDVTADENDRQEARYVMEMDNQDALDYVKQSMQNNQLFVIDKKRIKILCVEDGSVDTDKLEGVCKKLGVDLLIYRQGSKPPFILDVGE